MIISNSREFIFVHIMKTGGTTVSVALEPFLRWNDLILGGTAFGERLNGPYRERFGLRKHSMAREIRGVVGEGTWTRYFTFAFVRHPYARAVSYYGWLGRTIRRNPDRAAPVWSWASTQAFIESRDFSEFIRHAKFLENESARPQFESICDDAGRCIVDFTGRLEEFDAGMRTVSERLRLPLNPLGRLNSSSDERPAVDGLPRDEDDYRHLERLFAPDFARLGYDPAWRFPAPG